MKRIVLIVLLVAAYLSLMNAVSAKPSSWHRYDVNQDGRVDLKDLAIMAKVYNSYFSGSGWNSRFDFDRDGKISINDIALIARYFGT